MSIKNVKKYRHFIFAMLGLVIIVVLPPLLHKETYLVINNDTTAHLIVFDAMKSGTASYLYLGQTLAGWLMIRLERIAGTDIPTLFMWFNFAVLWLSGLSVAIMTNYITKSQLAGIISAPVVIFGTGATMHLFGSGTIFNIIEVLILLPILIVLIYKTFQSRKIQWLGAVIPWSVFMFFFHPSLGKRGITLIGKTATSSLTTDGIVIPPYIETVIDPITLLLVFFGISNLVALGFCIFGYYRRKNKEGIQLATKVVVGMLIILIIFFGVLTYTEATSFSSRTAFNTTLMLGLLLTLMIGIMLEYSQSRLAKVTVVSLVTGGTMPNLIQWLSFPNWKEIG